MLDMDQGRPKRYFINPWINGKNEPLDYNQEKWGEHVMELINLITTKLPPAASDGDGGLYVGAAGIGYMFHHLSGAHALAAQKNNLIQKAFEYTKVALQYYEQQQTSQSDKPAFMLGPAGVYALAAVLHQSAGNQSEADMYSTQFAMLAHNCILIDFLSCGGDELFVGRAGYICGALWLEKVFGSVVVPYGQLYKLCQSIILSGRQYAQRTKSQSPLMFSYYGTEYLGAAHGLCAILQMVMSVPGFLRSDPSAERDVRASVDYMLALQTSEGNFPCGTDEIRTRARRPEDELVHWCHGAPGVVYLMAKAYLVWKEERYLQSCIRCADLVWHKGLLRKGPGICHGVAGNGYVFLLLFRLTQDPVYLQRAQQFAHFLLSDEFRAGARSPDCPYSLYEGFAGTACFLVDLLQPDRAAFPFMDVF